MEEMNRNPNLEHVFCFIDAVKPRISIASPTVDDSDGNNTNTYEAINT
jgi:hypothetical protein